MLDLADRVRAERWDTEAGLALPGAGATAQRHAALLDVGRRDLSLARILEGHADALAIGAEAGHALQEGALYGVWASDGPRGRLDAMRLADGRWQLEGTKQYCSAATFATAALVTAHCEGTVRLFDVPIDQPGIDALPSSWATPALADTETGPVRFHRVILPAEAALGGDDWYLRRPGFWHGALGPAACWAGGAVSLVDLATAAGARDAHGRAQLGALQARAWGLRTLLNEAGREIDADPQDARGEAKRRALMVRHLIERCCMEVLDLFGRATGPALLAYDGHAARQHMALTVYIRQCHGERDLAEIPAPANP